jgi:hypothetical protein
MLFNSFPSPVNTHIINEVFQSCEPVSYFNLILSVTEKLDNRVVIAKGYGLNGKVRFSARAKNFSPLPSLYRELFPWR